MGCYFITKNKIVRWKRIGSVVSVSRKSVSSACGSFSCLHGSNGKSTGAWTYTLCSGYLAVFSQNLANALVLFVHTLRRTKADAVWSGRTIGTRSSHFSTGLLLDTVASSKLNMTVRMHVGILNFLLSNIRLRLNTCIATDLFSAISIAPYHLLLFKRKKGHYHFFGPDNKCK